MPTDHRQHLAGIRRFDQLIAYLRDKLDWPINSDDFEELTFEYTPEELGIDTKNAAKIQDIKRLRPLVPGQPWGIFFVKFEPKRLPVVALRRVLSQVALKKRASANKSERRAWAADDLLFVSNYGEGEERHITFAHFSQSRGSRELPTLKVLGWDNLDTPLHLDAIARELNDHLAWPDDETDLDAWRERWRAAFTLRHREVITTSKQLSERLAELARTIRDRIQTTLAIETEAGPLTQLMKAFQSTLVNDLNEAGFADMYAQTIAYGLLSARITDPTKASTEDLAAHMRTNPFLKELMETFLHVGGHRNDDGNSGIDFDELGVSEVVDLLELANMEAVVRDFGDHNPQEDPVIHFYEHFLDAYDKRQKVSRGVFYTPRSVVSFIVRSVDSLLRSEYGLVDGFADTTTWGTMVGRFKYLKIPKGISPDQSFIRILDPATGTGTFLVEIVDIIHNTMTKKWKSQGCSEKESLELWNEYVPNHLLPRLHGYELLMAPYAIAHLKIGLKLHETGYDFRRHERARVYLTNALEPPSDKQSTLDFLPALAHEATAVNKIKRETGFTVLIGNPPYAQYSSNLQDFAKAHIDKFRFSDGKRIRARNALQLERNLNDDYVKFMAFASDVVCSVSGVLGMITNRMFLESESLVGMREWIATHLKKGLFLDLHGSYEESLRVDRLAQDENVFDIRQGVAVSLLVTREKNSGDECVVLSQEVVGKTSDKYKALANDLTQFERGWKQHSPQSPNWWLNRDAIQTTPKMPTLTLDKVFEQYSTLIGSNRDHLVVNFDQNTLVKNINEVRDFRGADHELCEHFSITAKKGWNIATARNKLSEMDSIETFVQEIEYRPFDRRRIFFHSSLVWQMAPICSQNVFREPNFILISLGKNRARTTNGQWIATGLADKSVVSTRDNASGFPLYLFNNDSTALGLTEEGAQTYSQPNFTREFLEQLCATIGIESVDTFGLPSGITPEEILYYIYALLQAPTYRDFWADDLINGFPPVPLPPSDRLFRNLSRMGGQLAALHTLKSPPLGQSIATYKGPMCPKVESVGWSNGTIWLDAGKTNSNEGHRATKPGSFGFHGVREELWDFQIGGYQVCHKWLKDRKSRTLSDEDISHFQKILVALGETIRIMREIDEVIENHGGWPSAFQTGSEADKASEGTATVVPFRPPKAEPKPEDRYTTCVPLVALKAAAGGFSDPQFIEEDEFEWVAVTSGHRLRKGMFVAQVVGKSMEPAIPDSAWCLFRAPVEGTRQGKTVLVQLRDSTDPETGQSYTVKRYKSEKAQEGDLWRHEKILLEPVNPDFEPIVLTDADAGELQVIAELVHVLDHMDSSDRD